MCFFSLRRYFIFKNQSCKAETTYVPSFTDYARLALICVLREFTTGQRRFRLYS